MACHFAEDVSSDDATALSCRAKFYREHHLSMSRSPPDRPRPTAWLFAIAGGPNVKSGERGNVFLDWASPESRGRRPAACRAPIIRIGPI